MDTDTPSAQRRAKRLLLFSKAMMLIVAWQWLSAGPVGGFVVPAAKREFYLKLPIEGERFHWEFTDDSAFLAGELTLRIINGRRDDTLVIFRDGRISEGWALIESKRGSGRAYFGFTSDLRARTSHRDSLVLTLTAPQDLPGQGPYREGTLKAGTWQAAGTYSMLVGRRLNPIDALVLMGKPPTAFLQCWAQVWPVEVTAREGWKGPMPPGEEDGPSAYRKLNPERGVNGRRCVSHT